MQCSLHPLLADCAVHEDAREEGKIYGHIAGVQCQDWSGMGKHSGWHGPTCESFCAWLLTRLMRDKDYIIVENVSAFPAQELQALVESKFEMRTLIVNPSACGFPVNRRRQYMLLLNRKRWHWKASLDDDESCQQVFSDLFECECVLQGEDLCRAPKSLVEAHREQVAAGRGLPHKRLRGEDASSLGKCVLLSPACMANHPPLLCLAPIVLVICSRNIAVCWYRVTLLE